jgi:hypothetical protein
MALNTSNVHKIMWLMYGSNLMSNHLAGYEFYDKACTTYSQKFVHNYDPILAT